MEIFCGILVVVIIILAIQNSVLQDRLWKTRASLQRITSDSMLGKLRPYHVITFYMNLYKRLDADYRDQTTLMFMLWGNRFKTDKIPEFSQWIDFEAYAKSHNWISEDYGKRQLPFIKLEELKQDGERFKAIYDAATKEL